MWRLEPLRPRQAQCGYHTCDFVADSSIDFEEEEEVDGSANGDRNQREDDIVKRDEEFVDEDKKSHNRRREDDVEDWALFDFDGDVAFEEVCD